MFLTIIFIILMALLIVASGRALHMGIFKAHRQETAFSKRAIGGVASYTFSALVWLILYSHHYMKW